MVRLKSRYVLFEILYPPVTGTQYSKTEIYVSNHTQSPHQITSKTLLQEIRRSLQINFGDYGAGKVASLLQLKYFSNTTSMGIIRCHREDCTLLVAALSLISKVADIDGVIINPIKLSGTVKKIEQYGVRRNSMAISFLKAQPSSNSLTLQTSENDIKILDSHQNF
ncbi:hypothetical protein NCAS_0F01040 [Naumovozyma castellii]|uniref:Ribonuclease P/MRP protein subunit POP5 n=1 Tax=Naumovozyma castellii TaxID=27288 RepID=G0VGG7_NAUCA|nr:hypothetical protein NCAS_0F01040 [Naumovozyma castellii CBS 4309]CCC70588.1 hypothetical protein NCAS_0F01040 [Naumovozyma castellii CBS 4309]